MASDPAPVKTPDLSPAPPTGFTAYLISIGLTRDWFGWFWSRITAAAILIMSGIVPLDAYISERWQHIIMLVAGAVLFFSGHYDKSPLPSRAGLASAQAAVEKDKRA